MTSGIAFDRPDRLSRLRAFPYDRFKIYMKPGFHMSGKSPTIGDFTVSRLSQILPTNENSKS